MFKPIIIATPIAALSAVSLVANAACRSDEAPAARLPSPDPASVLSPAPLLDLDRLSGDKVKPPKSDEPQHFCCDDVGDGKHGKGGGTNCTAINKELLNQCSDLLFCPGAYYRKNGDVTCL